ncbi:MAG: hypothetical protein CMG00_07980 [Candidatus Marinimicrobia bacterium]|nr:hypothetical protein [Candidatus Neomarinimicrobiota bacterium]|tara:strand:- start:1783 stop:2622 length:840 start_codon:yes stop_codon:yes gene_type:complete
MIRFFLFNIVILSFIICNVDRSIIYSTGTYNPNEGYTISGDFSVANKFYIPNNDYGMEYFKFNLSKQSDVANVIFQIHEDENNKPGNIIGSWDFSISSDSAREYSIYAFQDCIDFLANQYYWLSLKAADAQTSAIWFYSEDNSFTYSYSNDNQTDWSIGEPGYSGNVKIYAEGYYYPEPVLGDMNQDFNLTIQDIIIMANHILENTDISNEVLFNADINSDFQLDIIDIILAIQIILNPKNMPLFELVDVNPNSTFFNQSIGPESFPNEVSCYYFGKQG